MTLLVGVLALLGGSAWVPDFGRLVLAGSAVDLRLAAGGGFVGGAGRMQAEVSDGAVSRKRCRPCAESWHWAHSRAQKKSGCDRFCNHTRST